MPLSRHDEPWLRRRVLRRELDPDTARFVAYMLTIFFTILITFLMTGFVFYKLMQPICIFVI